MDDSFSHLLRKPNWGVTDSEITFQAAANSWNGAGANFTFNYAGTTQNGWGRDGKNILSFADLGSSSIIAQSMSYIINDTLVESDIQFNTGFSWSTDTPTPAGKMDLQSIAVHELGHWLRLLDLYGTNDSTKVMYGFGSYGAMKRNLTPEDVAGIQWIYPSGNNCSYSISPTSQSFSDSGGTGSVNITTQGDCVWTASSSASWITITSGSSGTGSGTVNYSVASNTSTSPRSGIMTIAGRTFVVSQDGVETVLSNGTPVGGSITGSSHQSSWVYYYVDLRVVPPTLWSICIISRQMSISMSGEKVNPLYPHTTAVRRTSEQPASNATSVDPLRAGGG